MLKIGFLVVWDELELEEWVELELEDELDEFGL